jgi:transcriptional regulator with XRE-family HTH domain
VPENIITAIEPQDVEPSQEQSAPPAAAPMDGVLVSEHRRQLREKLGLSRAQVCQATGLTLSSVWRSEQTGRVVEAPIIHLLNEFLENVRINGIPAELAKPKKVVQTKEKAATRAELTERLTSLSALLDETLTVKSLKEVRTLIEQARVVAAGKATDQPAGEDQGAPVDGQGDPATEQDSATPEQSAA